MNLFYKESKKKSFFFFLFFFFLGGGGGGGGDFFFTKNPNLKKATLYLSGVREGEGDVGARVSEFFTKILN